MRAPRTKSRRPRARSAAERSIIPSVEPQALPTRLWTKQRRPASEDHMAVYSVFAPPPSTGEADAERFRFVRDGFSWGAFLLGPLWMIWRRLWLVLLICLVVVTAISVGL